MSIYRKLALYSDQDSPPNEEMDARLLRLIGRPQPKIGYIPGQAIPSVFISGVKLTITLGLVRIWSCA